MIDPGRFHRALGEAGVEFASGVPDSLLKEYCAYLDAVLPPTHHLIAANEGAAVGIAAGYHLATGTTPLVYLQNSGLGNTVNPLLSLADPEVYGIPLILLIGWRGEPGEKDEPQHVKQGRVSPAMLKSMEIPYRIIDGDEDRAFQAVKWAADKAATSSGPVALLVRKGAFGPSSLRRERAAPPDGACARERAIEMVTGALPGDAIIVGTTGHISRELYEQRGRLGQSRTSDFLTVGSMGHASQIALGISIARPGATVVCLDGDGAMLMHLGGTASAGVRGGRGFKHIVLNNGVHDSVGGQPTVGFEVSLTGIARACGYRTVIGPVAEDTAIEAALADLVRAPGPAFLEIRVAPGARADLGRPKESPQENKRLLMDGLRQQAR